MDTPDIIANVIAFVALIVALGSVYYTKRTYTAAYHPDLEQRLGASSVGINTANGTVAQQTTLSLIIRNLSSTIAVTDVTAQLFLSAIETDIALNERQLEIVFAASPGGFKKEIEFRKQRVEPIIPLSDSRFDIVKHLEEDLAELRITRKSRGGSRAESALRIDASSGTNPPRLYRLSDALLASQLQVRVRIEYRPSVRNAKPLINQKIYKLIPQYTLAGTSRQERVATLIGWTVEE